MALNKYMHPRNIYKHKKANFKDLALKYPEFKKHVFTDLKGKAFIDFKNASTLRQLTITLLKEDFGLDVVLPPEGLVPTIPLRLNYVHWIEDILQDCKAENISGIDIGPGASCVYPLLGCKLNSSWSFLAVEKCDTNLAYAEKNVKLNNLEDRIQVKKQVDKGILSEILKDSDVTYDFCMCNPPFFADHLEAQGMVSSGSDDRKEPSSVSTATPAESVTEGGEVSFIKQMMQESLELQSKIRVYTSMVGKKTSLPKLKEELRKLKMPNFSTTEFCQGKTMRWGIAWSFDTTVKFPKSLFQTREKEKPPLQYTLPPEFVSDLDLPSIAKQIYLILHEELKIKCDSSKASKECFSFDLTATGNTWSNQRRKRRAEKRHELKEKAKEGADSGKIVSSNAGGTDNLESGTEKPLKRKYQTFDLNDSGISECKRLRQDSEAKNSEMGTTKKSSEKVTGEKDESSDMTIEALSEECSTCKEALSNQDEGVVLASCSDTADLHGKTGITSSYGSSVPVASPSITQAEADNSCHSDMYSKEDYILKFKLNVKKAESYLLEMVWVDGQNRELMHQVLQYLKNKVKSNNNEQSKSTSASTVK